MSRSSTTRRSTTAACASTRRSSRARCTARRRTRIGAALWETFAYDEDGNLLTPNFYDYHVPHALDMPPLEDGRDRVARRRSRRSARRAWARAAAAASTRSARRSRTRSARAGGAIVTDSHNPYAPRLGDAPRPGGNPSERRGGVASERRRHEGASTRPREAGVARDRATRREMAGLMPGVESVRDQGRDALARPRSRCRSASAGSR